MHELGLKPQKSIEEKLDMLYKEKLKKTHPDSHYDPIQLKKGTKVEIEHTTDKKLAKTIAKHHLDESPNYYIELEKMEKKLLKK